MTKRTDGCGTPGDSIQTKGLPKTYIDDKKRKRGEVATKTTPSMYMKPETKKLSSPPQQRYESMQVYDLKTLEVSRINRRLDHLLESGAISQEEYNRMKAQIPKQ